MRPVRIALWIPCVLSALGLHLLALTIGVSAHTESEFEITPTPADFFLVPSRNAVLEQELLLAPVATQCARPLFGDQALVFLSDLEREIRDLGPAHAWAGEYALGEDERLYLAPRNGFWFERSPWCSTGLVRSEPRDLLLAGGGPVERLVPIHWGARHYLVADSEWPDFLAAMRRGEEPRSTLEGRFLLRVGDERLRSAGWPRIVAP